MVTILTNNHVINGWPMTTRDSLSALITAHQPGDSVSVTFTTSTGASQSATVTLVAGPASQRVGLSGLALLAPFPAWLPGSRPFRDSTGGLLHHAAGSSAPVPASAHDSPAGD